jgi:hypothetical protein
MHWPWQPKQNELDSQSLRRLKQWYRILLASRYIFTAALLISLLVLISNSLFVPCLILPLMWWYMWWILGKFIDDVVDYAQDIVVYDHCPKFKHKI